MIRIHHTIITLIAGIPAVVMAPVAHADETVSYEVISSDVAVANVEYFDRSGRKHRNTCRCHGESTRRWSTHTATTPRFAPTGEAA